MLSLPVLTETELLTKVDSVIASCVSVPQVINAVNWGRNLGKMQNFSNDTQVSVSYTIDFLGNKRATAIEGVSL
jgi:hypothetical protein